MNKKLIRLLLGLFDALERDLESQSMKEVLRLNNRQREKLIDEAVQVVMDEELDDNRLDIPRRDRQAIKRELSKKLDEATKEEFAYEEEVIGSALALRAQEVFQINTFFYSEVFEVDFVTEFIQGTADATLGFGGLSPDEIQDIINENIKSELWSDRLWRNKKALNKDLRKELYDLIDGKTDVNQISDRISQKYKRSYSEARRLVRNEGARVQNAVNDVWAERNDVEEQLFEATLDNRTSAICRGLDGKRYKIDDPDKPKIPDETHINCRSVLVNVPYSGWQPKKRYDNISKRNINYQTYKEWANG